MRREMDDPIFRQVELRNIFTARIEIERLKRCVDRRVGKDRLGFAAGEWQSRNFVSVVLIFARQEPRIEQVTSKRFLKAARHRLRNRISALEPFVFDRENWVRKDGDRAGRRWA